MSIEPTAAQTEAALSNSFSGARRKFMTRMGLLGAAAGTGVLGLSSDATAALPIGFRAGDSNIRVVDSDILNFALNLEYLEAEFYLRAVGRSLDAVDIAGTGELGGVTGGSEVPFSNPVIRQYANEIANDELAHVRILRTLLGRKRVARPQLDFTNAFTNAAIAAGIITTGQTFDPFANDLNFLLGAFIFEDVGVTAYAGAAQYIRNEAVLLGAAQILAVEAYHAGEIRTLLFGQAQTNASIFTTVQQISDLRDGADGSDDKDQGIRDSSNNANIVPTDANGLVYTRTFRQVLRVVYLGGASGAFGFFPNRLNGDIR